MSNKQKIKGSSVPRSMQSNYQIELAENKLCSKVGKVLQKHYPGWGWYVDCTLSTGVITVKNLNIHGDYGFILYITQIEQPGGEAIAIRAGGELLERCGFPRGIKPENLDEQFNVKRDGRGNVKDLDLHMSGGSS